MRFFFFVQNIINKKKKMSSDGGDGSSASSTQGIRSRALKDQKVIQSGPTILNGVTNNYVADAFGSMDDDNNGYLGVKEIRLVLKKIGKTVDDDVIDEMIRMADSDGAGQVSLDCYQQLLTSSAMIDEMYGLDETQHRYRTKRMLWDNVGYQDIDPDIEENIKKKTEEKEKPSDPTEATVGILLQSHKAHMQKVKQENPKAFGSRGRRHVANVLENRKAGVIKPSQLKKIVEQFRAVDVDGNQELDFQEFCKAMKKEESAAMRRMFEMFDTDQSGTIALKEFLVGLTSYVSLNPEERSKFTFLLIDEDQSGYIERHELIKILRANFINQGQKEELLEARADKIFKVAKLPPDGRMDFNQFMRVTKTTPGLLFPVHTLMDRLDNMGGAAKK